MSHTLKASSKPSFGAPWRVSNTVVSRRNAGWTTSNSGHVCPCQNCSQRSPAGKTGRESMLNHSLCTPNDPVGQGTELNDWQKWQVLHRVVFCTFQVQQSLISARFRTSLCPMPHRVHSEVRCVHYYYCLLPFSFPFVSHSVTAVQFLSAFHSC